MLPKQERETFGKHITKPSEHVAAPPSKSLTLTVQFPSLIILRARGLANARLCGVVTVRTAGRPSTFEPRFREICASMASTAEGSRTTAMASLAAEVAPEGRRLNGIPALSLNDRTILLLAIVLDRTVSVG